MHEYTATVTESQLDWLTLSTHSRTTTDLLRSYCERWVGREIDDGAKVHPFRLMGYVGWRAGRVRYGERENAGLVQLSGDLARQHFDTLYPVKATVSRLDVAVTARTLEADPGLGERAYGDAEAFHAEHVGSALPSCVKDADGGWTTYVGRRTSDYFLRIYNKEAEQKASGDLDHSDQYRASWRYELELKGPAAEAYALAYSRAGDRHAWCQNLVHDYASKHGIYPCFPSDGNRVLGPALRRRSDRDSRLHWFRTSVRPALEWLLQNGDRTEVMQALGLETDTAL